MNGKESFYCQHFHLINPAFRNKNLNFLSKKITISLNLLVLLQQTVTYEHFSRVPIEELFRSRIRKKPKVAATTSLWGTGV